VQKETETYCSSTYYQLEEEVRERASREGTEKQKSERSAKTEAERRRYLPFIIPPVHLKANERDEEEG
jgi:hypothetical protein